ncbi:NUDIX domain-containing protein [Nocardioides sp. Leaf285]|uniref:NUDIX domain-containing protein n=1 Tax=Nocardioides sp. Leaf285 TaxID=1736322 RepID=UPI0007034671|nr:NUDIX domain-containing protein [Nocardioides sp. Leaf285]KQP63050.1 hypothetical protein ASF47_18740 [Nocardioides sp. Leaf285]
MNHPAHPAHPEATTPATASPAAPESSTGRIDYVGGFLFDPLDRVALIHKTRGAQAGHLNGVGGHVEPGESALAAMVREFHEETGLTTGEGEWDHFATLTGPAYRVWWYRATRSTRDLLEIAGFTTDEGRIEIHDAHQAQAEARVMPSLQVLLPLAAYRQDRYEPVLLNEIAPGATPDAARPSGCSHLFPDGTRCTLSEATHRDVPGLAAVHGTGRS